MSETGAMNSTSSAGNMTAAAGNATAAAPVPMGPPLQPAMTEFQIKILAVIYTMEVLSVLFVGFRIYCRVAYLKKLLWTDAWLVLALAFQIVVQSFNVVEILRTLQAYEHAGFSDLTSVNAVFVQFIAFWCLRISVGLLFLEIFPGRRPRIIVGLGLLLVTLGTYVPIFWMGSCMWPLYGKPNTLQLLWAKCASSGFKPMVLNTVTGLLFDIGAVVLPMIPVWSLNMTAGKKLSLTFILALGWFTVASSAIRFVLSIQVLIHGPLGTGMQTNFTIFAAVEMHVGLIAASLLTTWRVIQSRFLPKSLSTFFSSIASSAGGSGSGSKVKSSRSGSKGPHGRMGTRDKDLEASEMYPLESRSGDESGLLRTEAERERGGITVHTGFSVTTRDRLDHENDKDKGIETVDVEVTAGSEGRRSF